MIADATAIDRGESNIRLELSLATFRYPDALIFKEMHASAVSAWVCASCGYVEFYADRPEAMKLPKT